MTILLTDALPSGRAVSHLFVQLVVNHIAPGNSGVPSTAATSGRVARDGELGMRARCAIGLAVARGERAAGAQDREHASA